MKQKSIVNKILIVFILTGIVVAVVSNYFNAKFMMEQYESQLYANNTHFLAATKNRIEDELKGYEMTIESLALIAKNRFKDVDTVVPDMNTEEAYFIQLLSEYLTSEDALTDSVYIYFDPYLDGDVHDVWVTVDEAGETTRHDEIPLERYVNDENMTWFTGPRALGVGSWVDPYYNRYNQHISSYVSPIYVGQRFIGIIGGYLYLDKIGQMLENETQFDEDTFWMYNRQGEVIFHRTYEEGTPIWDIIKNDAEVDDGMITMEDRNYYKYEAHIDNGWTVVYLMPDSVFQEKENRIVLYVFIVVAISLMCLVVLVLILAGRYRMIFEHIIDVLQDIKNGHIERRITVFTNDEIGLMSEAINDSNDSLMDSRALELERINKHLEDEILEKKKVQDQLEVSMELANAASAAKSEFLANMSHEIRTPIHAITGFNYLLQRTELTEQQQDYIDKSIHASKHLLNIIENILDISKIEANELRINKERMNLYECINDVYETVMVRLTSSKVAFKISVDQTVPEWIIGDEHRLYQILLNLVNNAMKFTEEGQITVLVAYVTSMTDTFLRFYVNDTGIGIPESDIDRLFEPFFQVDSKASKHYEGTGLGLNITRNLIKLMDGEMEVTSKLGQGSQFNFIIPCVVADQDIDFGDAFSHIHVGLMGKELEKSVCRKQLIQLGCQVSVVKQITDDYTHIIVTDDMGDCVKRYPDIRWLQFSKHRFEHMNTYDFEHHMIYEPMALNRLIDILENREVDHDTEVYKSMFNKHRVLLVEDNEINQQIGKEILERAGLEITIAKDGLDAIELIEHQDFDLVLMDIHMPRMDGYETTARIREKYDQALLPVIAVTADAFLEVKGKIADAGMNDYVTKPFDVDQLKVLLAKWL